MWRPHCWQYAKPSGVCVPHRGHEIVLPWGARNAGAARLVGIIPSATGAGGIDASMAGSGGSEPIPGMPPTGPNSGTAEAGGGENPPIGPGGMPGIGPPSIGPPAMGLGSGPGRPIGPPDAGDPAPVDASELPQLRQNFMPGGFSPWHTPHTEMPGNPCAEGGVCAKACAPEDSELPQFRQNDDPAGLSWPHFEQRIVPLTLNPIQVSQQPQASGMGAGRFTTP
jgi:hypothetical protein